MKKIGLIFLLLSLTAHCENKFSKVYQADLPNKADSIVYSKDGKIKELVVSSWNDRIKSDNGFKYLKYQQGYSYEKRQGFIKVYNNDGKLIQEDWSNKNDGGVAKEEVLISFDLFKNNDVVKKHFASTDLELRIFGGFNFMDDTECKPGSRCVHVFAGTEKTTIIAHSIIRLVDSTVVYPDYDMQSGSEITLK